MQSGNVLFLILIAVALFAALSYAVTQSTRSGGGNANAETAKTNAAAIVNFGTTARAAITRMKISNNCAENMFDFTNSVYKLMDGSPMQTANSNAPADFRCHLFDPRGGGVAPVLFSKKAFDYSLSPYATPGHALVRVSLVANVGTDNLGVGSNDLILSILYLTKETCMAVNKIVGVANPGGNPPAGTARYDGDYANGSFAGSSAYYATETAGQYTFCADTSGTTGYEFVQVLIAR